MFLYRKFSSFTRFAASAAIAAGLALASPAVVYADAAADLASARANLEQIGQKVEDISGELETLVTELDNTEYEIMVKEQKIAQNQEVLADFVSAEYKGGAAELLSIILGSTSVDDMVSRIRYVQKISDAQTSAIDEIKTAKTDLEERRDYQQSMLDDTQAKLDELNSQRSSAASLVDSLDAEVKAQLEKEAAENAKLNVALEQSKVQKNPGSASSVDEARDTVDSIKQESSDSKPGKNDNAGGDSGNSGNAGGGSTAKDDPSTNNVQRPDTPSGGNTDYSSRGRDSSMYNVTWGGDTEYINRLAQKAANVGSSTNYFLAWDNELCRFIVFTRSGGGWVASQLWNCNGARNTYSGAWTVVHKQKCNWADEYFGMGYNDWSTCFIESYSRSSLGHLRYIPGKGYEDCASIHSTGYSETGWGNTGCCGLLYDNAKWIYDNVPNGSTVYVFRYSDGRVF